MQAYSMKQLREQAKQLNLPNIHAETKQALAMRVQSAMQTMTQPPKPLGKTAEPPVFKKHYTTPEELMAALEPYKNKNLQVKIEDDTWHFKYGVAEDSGTLHQPVEVIKRMAEMILKARMPAKIKTTLNEVVLAG